MGGVRNRVIPFTRGVPSGLRGALNFNIIIIIKWYSKRQNTVETSTYGAELVTLRNATEIIIEFRYKLRPPPCVDQGLSYAITKVWF